MVNDRSHEELVGWLRLSAEPGLSRAVIRHLLKELGLPQHILSASAAALSRHLPQDIVARLQAPASPEVQAVIDTALRLLAQPDHYLITLADAAYPTALFDTGDPPVLLYVRGKPELLHQPAMAIVGARNATEGGKDNARAFARHLAGRGWSVISGLARGIDAAAHEGALQAGPTAGGTIAVLASGLDVIYPRQHGKLTEDIAAHGALVTEYPPGTPAQPFRFPDRNRLVAGLARGILVVEAAVQSGSLLTARLAGEYGREVFAIPGSIHAPLSRGCHALIRQGAKLVEQGSDIEEELLRTGPVPQAVGQAQAPTFTSYENRPPHAAQPFTNTTGNVQSTPPSQGRRPTSRILKDPTVGRVLSALGYDPADADQLCRRSGLEFSRIAAILTELELNDIVQRMDDGRYQRRQQELL
ncbi:DNA-processing protein DprA [Achromobacter sp. F4_2707]|uniref:DNA-processing protein DprA n=1 Tax=Achromobacter sp. F4_2707 TaxID=3114286 RepID=UPI0039C72EA0